VQAVVFQLLWEERDGPPVKTPISRGFGTRSVIASIESQLGGQAEFDWRSEGLICRLSVPLTKNSPSREFDGHQDFAVADTAPSRLRELPKASSL
jgi:hypothetical protein